MVNTVLCYRRGTAPLAPVPPKAPSFTHKTANLILAEDKRGVCVCVCVRQREAESELHNTAVPKVINLATNIFQIIL